MNASTPILSAEALSAIASKQRGIDRYPVTNRESWLARRQQDVTASAAGALLGVHEYQTVYGLWALKSGLLTEDVEETPPMRRGRLLEPVALQLLREERPTWSIDPGRHYFRHAADRIGATPDAFAIDPARPGFGIVQFKTVEPSIFRRKWCSDEDHGATEPPLWIVVQAIIEAELTGASWACVAPLVVGFGLDLPVIEVPIHAGIMDRLRDEVAAFWRMVESKTPPDPDYGRDGELLAKIYADDDGTEIDLSNDNHLPILIDERDRLKSEIKTSEDRCKEIETEFKAKLGTHATAILSDRRRVSWKTQHRKGYTVEPTSFRVLRFAKAK